jgi:hypothetical protein
MAGPKLNAEQVEQIKLMSAEGIQGQVIADKFGVTRQLVSLIEVGQLWKAIRPDLTRPSGRKYRAKSPEFRSKKRDEKGHILQLQGICTVCGGENWQLKQWTRVGKYSSSLCRACYDNAETRFWSRVGPANAQGCRDWMGSRFPTGYGRWNIADDGCTPSDTYSHRAAYMFAHKLSVLPDGMQVTHSCNRPSCCEPTHLSLETPLENNRYREECGRGNRKALTQAKADEIRRLNVRGVSPKELAELFRVNVITINHVLNGKAWVARAEGPLTESQKTLICALHASGNTYLSIMSSANATFSQVVLTIRKYRTAGKTHTKAE